MTELTPAMQDALRMLERARERGTHRDLNAPPGVMTGLSSFYDAERDVAYVHWKTAHALELANLVRSALNDELGYDIWLI